MRFRVYRVYRVYRLYRVYRVYRVYLMGFKVLCSSHVRCHGNEKPRPFALAYSDQRAPEHCAVMYK